MNREQLKQLIRESVDEVINEIGAVDYNDYEPMDSMEDRFADWLANLKVSLKNHLEKVENDQDPEGVHYEKMFAVDDKISKFLILVKNTVNDMIVVLFFWNAFLLMIP